MNKEYEQDKMVLVNKVIYGL